ncbi:MAG TPA: hypothetical protein VFS02_20110 [Telluria sp.]|nr:hypothetical protein [Telluria sp.]
MWHAIKPSHKNLIAWQLLLLIAFFGAWHIVSRNPDTAFFFGEPLKVFARLWQWFTVGSGSLEVGMGDSTWFTLHFPAEIYSHLLVTLTETVLAFAIGTTLGLVAGLWLALSPLTSAILDPDIILMDEPFSALDIQTRQLMENEVLDLWSAKKKAVLFITHDLDEAIAMSDRVIVLSAGPATHPIGEFVIDLPRPRDVAEIRSHPRFVELHAQIWSVLRDEVLKGYQQQKKAA